MIAPDIRKIEREELPLIRNLAPPEWHLNLENMYRQHYGQPYFYPTVTMLGADAAGSPENIKSGFPSGGNAGSFLISPIKEKDFLPILALDRHVSGEERKGLLLHTMATGFKYEDGGIRGYYLPDFGKGLVIADTDAAGLGLLKYKINRERSSVCIPEANAAAAGLLAAVGYEPYLRATRMFLHRNIQWDPTKVYARGSGALG